MSIRTGILGVMAALTLSISLPYSSFAENVDFLRSIPLEVSGYASAQAFPEKFTTAEQVIQAINNTPVLLVHMEALRRGYHELPIDEQEKLLTALHKRRMTNEHDLVLGFDHGYAQLVYKQNKTGLFFLRKANDKIQDQFSNLAYGMAQVEADINLEDAAPDQTTTRKMDAVYKLGDAVKIDAMKHQPGFWPTYMRVVEKMKELPAYKSFTRRDFSLAYIPLGNKVVPMTGANTSSIPLTDKPASLLSSAMNTSCQPAANDMDIENNQNAAILAQRSANFNGNQALILFSPTEEPHLYRVKVLGPSGQPMLSFKSHTMPNVVEDIDGDGVFEIVARQYQYNPMQPIIVYRYTPCGFELDKEIFGNFQ
jgi:hypothetical protein